MSHRTECAQSTYQSLFRLVFSGVILILYGCAAHPTVAHKTLRKGESYYGYSLSLENVFPVLFYRYGLTEVSDAGFRIGVPIYGSGIDYSRVLYEKEGKRDVLNLAWSFTPNSSFDFTYYKFSKKKKRPLVTSFWGLRGMMIPKGIGGSQSARLGFLLGSYTKGKFGYEIGYFHDFSSMPITKLFSADTSGWGERYREFPHVTDFGLPSEHSRLTGLSVRVTFLLSGRKKAARKSPAPEIVPPPEKSDIEKREWHPLSQGPGSTLY